jgi:hypothetical protein
VHVRERWSQQPVVAGLVVGCVIFGALGCLAGLVRGLATYAPTAWAATFEVGAPSALLGAALGATVGLVASVCRRSS